MMRSLNELPLDEAITLYYEKHHALRYGDMAKLRELKNICAEIFDEKIDAQIRDIINYAKKFEASGRYKELRKMELKKMLAVISDK